MSPSTAELRLGELLAEANALCEQRDVETAIERLEEALAIEPTSAEVLDGLNELRDALPRLDVEELLTTAEELVNEGQNQQVVPIAERVLALDRDNQDALELLDRYGGGSGEDESPELEPPQFTAPSARLKERLDHLATLADLAREVDRLVAVGDLPAARRRLAEHEPAFRGAKPLASLKKRLRKREIESRKLYRKAKSFFKHRNFEQADETLQAMGKLGLGGRNVRRLRVKVRDALEEKQRQEQQRDKKRNRALLAVGQIRRSLSEGRPDTAERLLVQAEHELGARSEHLAGLRHEVTGATQALEKGRRAESRLRKKLDRTVERIDRLIDNRDFEAAWEALGEAELEFGPQEELVELRELLEPRSEKCVLQWVEDPEVETHEKGIAVRLKFENQGDHVVTLRDLKLKENGILKANHRMLDIVVRPRECCDDLPGCRGRLLKLRSWWARHLEARVWLTTGEVRCAKVQLPRRTRTVSEARALLADGPSALAPDSPLQPNESFR